MEAASLAQKVNLALAILLHDIRVSVLVARTCESSVLGTADLVFLRFGRRGAQLPGLAHFDGLVGRDSAELLFVVAQRFLLLLMNQNLIANQALLLERFVS